MQIRELRRADFEGVRRLYDYAHKEIICNPDYGDYVRLKKPTRKERIEQFDRWLKEKNGGDLLFYVAEDKGRIIGFCFVRKTSIPDSELSHVGILGARVAKELRGRGIGQKLIRYALERSRKRFEIIEIEILGINAKSKHIFSKFGFRTWGIAPGFVKRGNRYIDLEHMYLKLPALR